MDDKVLIAQIDDARNDSVNDVAGLLILADGRQTAESGEFWSAEVQLDSLILDGLKFKKCGGLLFFCGGCDKFAHGKGLCYFFVFGYYKYNTYFSDYQMVTENPLLFL